MKHVFVINPASGANDHENEIRQILSACGRLNECEIHITESPAEATEFVDTWCRRHREAVRFYACGGDGTLNEVIAGVMGHPEASVACYPCGSGNDYVKYYGGAARFLDIDALIAAEEKTVDVMRAGDRYSLNVTNFGFDTEVAKTMHEVRHKKLIGGKNAYTTGIVKALVTAMKNDCTVWVDGEKLNDGKMLLCTVSNGRYVGGAYCCAPHSANDDGLLDVCLVKPLSRFTFIKLIGVYKQGKHLDDPRFKNLITYRRGKTVRVLAPEGFGYTLDGEIVMEHDFTIEICPGAIRFAVPAEKKESVAAPADAVLEATL